MPERALLHFVVCLNGFDGETAKATTVNLAVTEIRFHTALYGHRPVAKSIAVAMRGAGTGCSLISGLRAGRCLQALMEFAKNVLISVTRLNAQGCVQVCVLAVRPVSPSLEYRPQQPNDS